jgi:hypothetical protein
MDQKFVGGGSYFYTDNFNSLGGYRPDRIGTEDLTYEKSYKYNFGFDLYMFNKLSVIIDAYYNHRTDILVNTDAVISDVLGVVPAKENMGIVNNRGIELELMWNDYIGKLSYYVGGSFTYNKNKIIEQNEEYRPYDYLKRTGLPIGQYFGYEVLGFFRDSTDIANSPVQMFSPVRPGDVKYKDQNNDGKIDQFDEIPIGYSGSYPEIYYSIKLGFEVSGFGVDLLFQGKAHQTLYLNSESVFWPLRNYKSITDFSDNTWTPETADEATLPRLTLLENPNNYRQNSIWLKDGDYLKLRSLKVHYTFPEKWIKWAGLDETEFFATGMNLFSMDKIKYVDPEFITYGYPTLTTWQFGVKVSF